MKTLVLEEGKYKIRFNEKAGEVDLKKSGTTLPLTEFEQALVKEITRVTDSAYSEIWKYIKSEAAGSDWFRKILDMKKKVPEGQDWKLINTLLDSLKKNNDAFRKEFAEKATSKIIVPGDPRFRG